MDIGKTLIDRLQMHTLRWLVKGPGAAWLVAGTFAFAGIGAASLNAPAGASGQQGRDTVGSSSMSMSAAGCYADPDGDGHIFCDGTVAVDKLPASFGPCSSDSDGYGRIFCRGTGN